MSVVAVAEAPGAAAALAGLGHDVSLLDAPDPGVEVSPGFLAESYRLYRALRGRALDAVVFDGRDGPAYCAAAAKRLGLAFESTAIVVHWDGTRREAPAFLSKSALGRAVTERLAIELADAVVCADKDVLASLAAEGWSLPPTRGQSWEEALVAPGVRRPLGASPPLVSVVVPRHERTTYLPFCLEALARQTYDRLEVILVDDGSASPTAAAQLAELEARSWPWPLRVLRLPRGGVAAARNAGWRAASGELVVFVDDDDVPFDELVRTLVECRAASGADVLAAGARFFRGDGAPRPHEGDVVLIRLGAPHELGLISNQYGGPTCLWPRDLLEQLGGFSTEPRLFEDWELLARASLGGARVLAVPEPLYWYRQTPGGKYGVDLAEGRDTNVASIARLFAERLPEEARLLPQLAAGAYAELERRKQAATPARRLAAERGRLLVRRTREVHAEGGLRAVVRRALGFARRLRSSA